MLDRTQSLSRKVEHLPTKLSVQSHQLQLTVVFSINRWCLLKIQPENQFSETNGKNQEWTSGLARESQQNTTAQTQRSLPPPSSEVGCTSIFKLNQGSHCGPHLRPAATWKVPELLEVLDLQSCISQPNLMSGMCRISPNKSVRFDQEDVIQIKTLKWFRSG